MSTRCTSQFTYTENKGDDPDGKRGGWYASVLGQSHNRERHNQDQRRPPATTPDAATGDGSGSMAKSIS